MNHGAEMTVTVSELFLFCIYFLYSWCDVLNDVINLINVDVDVDFRKGLIEFLHWQRNWIVKLWSEENHSVLIFILDLIFFIHVKSISIQENASSTIYLVSCWEKHMPSNTVSNHI